MTLKQLKEQHPQIYKVMWTDELDEQTKPLKKGEGYAHFKQMGMKLKAKKALTEQNK